VFAAVHCVMPGVSHIQGSGFAWGHCGTRGTYPAHRPEYSKRRVLQKSACLRAARMTGPAAMAGTGASAAGQRILSFAIKRAPPASPYRTRLPND